MAYTLPVKITFFKAQYYTLGRVEPVRAIVNHRMVGTVAGTRSYFQHPNRPVSTHFGIGKISGKIVIDQYVPLDDTAFGNGNYDATGDWDNWGYPTSNINAQTINIEHQDYGDPAGTGVVSEDIQQASIRLQALLMRGSVKEWQDAGVRLRDWKNAAILQKELHAFVPGPRRIITHHDIAGRLKPYCWMPWNQDRVGFPRTKYIAGINSIIASQVPVPPAPPEDDMRGFVLTGGKPSGYLRVKGTGHYYIDLHTNKAVGPLPDGWPGSPKRAHPAVLDVAIPGGAVGDDRRTGYVMPDGPAFILASDVTFVPDVVVTKAQPKNAADLRALADKVEKGVE